MTLLRSVQPLTADQIASAFIAEGVRRKITPRGIQVCIATGLVESDLQVYSNPNDPPSEQICPDCPDSFDGSSTGPLQQQAFDEWGGATPSGTRCRMDPACSAGLFYDHMMNPTKYGLDKNFDYNNPGMTPGEVAQAVQRSAFPDRYDQRFSEAVAIFNRLSGGQPVTPATPGPLDLLAAVRPDFNEYPVWSNNAQDRGGSTVDLWLIHTEEGSMNADDLAHWLDANGVSYHYTASEDPNDHGVTVCDVVDTDKASWSVLASNNRAINCCFAGSSADWTRAQWLAQSKAIEAAAYLAVQDTIKYPGLQIAGPGVRVIPPPYTLNPPGVSDHRYCTEHLRDGNTHTDVGDNFPWDLFAARVTYYWQVAYPNPSPTPTPLPPPPAPTPAPAPPGPPSAPVLVSNAPAIPKPADQAAQISQVWDQLLLRWDILNGRTLVEAIADLHNKLGT